MSMRQSYTPTFLTNEQGEVCGIILPGDYCAEHEWGIEELKRHMGVKENPEIDGIDRRRIGKVEAIYFYDDGPRKIKSGKSFLIVGKEAIQFEQYYDWKKLPPGLHPIRLRGKQAALTAAWGSESFGIYAETDEDRSKLRLIHEAIKSGDCAIWLGGAGKNPFARNGLVIGIVSKCDPKSKDTMLESDLEGKRLATADKATGIREKLAAAGKRFYALSPGWPLKSTSRGEVKTSHPIMYFLNPQDQKNYDHGWFTVEELEAWAKDEGPVVKQHTPPPAA
jgi:hypothetical protein